MPKENEYEEALGAVESADRTVGQAQANSNSRDLQISQQHILKAEQFVKQAEQINAKDVDHMKQLKRSEEYLRHMKETQAAMQSRKD